jgi:hypothetical protein
MATTESEDVYTFRQEIDDLIDEKERTQRWLVFAVALLLATWIGIALYA